MACAIKKKDNIYFFLTISANSPVFVRVNRRFPGAFEGLVTQEVTQEVTQGGPCVTKIRVWSISS